MKNIKEIRAKTGMSRTKFYEAFGVPERTLEDWETGRRTPPAYVTKMLEKQVTDYCNKNSKEVDRYFNDFMQYCFIMDRSEYADYIKSEAYSCYIPDAEVTLENIKKSIFDIYREFDPDTNSCFDEPHLYTKKQAWDEVSDYANQDFYSLEQLAEDIYKAYLTNKETE